MKQQTDHVPDVRKKVTAVEWLIKELTNLGYIHAPSFGHAIIDGKIEAAKQMEKMQIMETWIEAWIGTNTCDSPEEYYNETYKK